MAAMQMIRRERQPPHFSVIMLEYPIPQNRLMIPEKSAMIFGKELSEDAIIVAPNGRSWNVELKREGEKIWLCDGLQGFLDYLSVQYFYNLHFRYEGNSVFYVCICDEMGAEIDYPCVDPNGDPENKFDELVCKLEDGIGDDQSNEIFGVEPSMSCAGSKRKACNRGLDLENLRKIGSFVSGQKMGRSNKRLRRANSVAYHTRSRSRKKEEEVEVKESGDGSNSGLIKPKCNSKSSPRNARVKTEGNHVEMISPKNLTHLASVKTPMSKETMRAIQAAKMGKLKNPSFMAILTTYSLKHSYVGVPAEFVSKHLNLSSEEILLQARTGRKKWLARWYRIDRGGSVARRIGKGWGQFSAKERLKEGDVCVFELMKKGNTEAVLRVWIYRAADYEKPG